MPRKSDPARACLKIENWPAADQALWHRAVNGHNYESDVDVPASWRPTSIQTNREGYGRWINHLSRSGEDMGLPPAERMTPARVQAYLSELRAQGLAPQTRSNRISQLLSVMLVFAPDRDWDWLRQKFNRQEAIAQQERKPEPLTVLAGDVLDRTFKYLKAHRRKDSVQDIAAALEYRNWLMLAMLTLVPLRRDNFTNLSFEKHFKSRNGEWIIEIPSAQAKHKRPIRQPVPKSLDEFIRFYLEEARPILLAGRTADAFWITNRHTPMTSHSVFVCITNFTTEVFGSAINPHRFRHIAATSTVIANPEQTEEARALMGHSKKKMTEDRYIIAQSLAASRQHAALVAQLRRNCRRCEFSRRS